MKEYKVSVQQLIDHIKTAFDVDPWAKEMAEELLKEQGKQKFFVDAEGKITPLPIVFPNCPLKEQETEWEHLWDAPDGTFKGRCKKCGFVHFFIEGHDTQYKFCPECGRSVKWE